MTDYKPGDLVSLEHAETGQAMMNFTVEAVGSLSAIRSIWRTEPVYLNELPAGWRVADHKPKIELPTESGWYMSASGKNLYRLTIMGDWIEHSSANSWKRTPEEVLDWIKEPFTRLVPEGSEREAAIREVINWFQEEFSLTTSATEAREHFGITE